MNVKVKVKSRQGRGRRVMGWVLLGLGVLVAGVWLASGWRLIEFGSADRQVWVYTGCLGVEFKTPDPSGLRIFGTVMELEHAERPGFDGLSWLAHDKRTNGFFDVTPRAFDTDLLVIGLRDYPNGDGSLVHVRCIALWPVVVLLGIPTCLLLRSGFAARRRATRNMCEGCGYSRAGLGAGAVCPECGKGEGAK